MSCGRSVRLPCHLSIVFVVDRDFYRLSYILASLLFQDCYASLQRGCSHQSINIIAAVGRRGSEVSDADDCVIRMETNQCYCHHRLTTNVIWAVRIRTFSEVSRQVKRGMNSSRVICFDTKAAYPLIGLLRAAKSTPTLLLSIALILRCIRCGHEQQYLPGLCRNLPYLYRIWLF